MIATYLAIYIALCSLLTLISSLHRCKTTTYVRPRPIASHPFNK